MNLTTEGKVVADEDPCASNKAGRIGLIVRVSKTYNPAKVRYISVWQGDAKNPEVSVSVVTQGMRLFCNKEPAAAKLEFDFVQNACVTEWIPRGGGWRGWNFIERIPAN